ncbi:glutamate 5-kinase [Candidatus Peregrinibacteria bacterium]|nr:glutamate 5-kinase [Candidatus Peregrinibacteria bacterium]
MAKSRYRRIVVKVGTNVIAGEDGLLQNVVMRSLTQQIASLRKEGTEIVLVSSGAMAAGRVKITPSKNTTKVTSRQVLAAVGQVELVHRYAELFATQEIITAQVLATKEDFRDRQHYLNMRGCFEALLNEGIIPIVNENDVVSVSELMFTDNDELAGLVASMLQADALILLTNVNGIHDGDPENPSSQLLREAPSSNAEWERIIHPRLSQFGRGGMLTKCKTARKLAALGIQTHIANGMVENILPMILEGAPVGTVFRAEKQASSAKRWVAGSEGREKGTVTINACAVDVITSKERAASLLPVGITGVEGAFEKGDLVRVVSEEGKAVAIGVAGYGAQKAREAIGKKGQRPLIHYDYLFLLS